MFVNAQIMSKSVIGKWYKKSRSEKKTFAADAIGESTT